MKREETIKWLKSLKAEIGKSEHRALWHYAEAIDLAIEALTTEVPTSDDLIIKGAKGIQDGLYNIKDGKLFKYKANGGTVRTYPIVSSAEKREEEYADEIARRIATIIENEQDMRVILESAEAEQHNKDAISREGLLKSWEELSPRGRLEFDQVIMTIPALPSAEVAQGWIPCSERLPKENEYVDNVCKYYLTQDEYGDMHVAHLSSRGWETIESVKALGCDVVAWMPLPKPYKNDDE